MLNLTPRHNPGIPKSSWVIGRSSVSCVFWLCLAGWWLITFGYLSRMPPEIKIFLAIGIIIGLIFAAYKGLDEVIETTARYRKRWKKTKPQLISWSRQHRTMSFLSFMMVGAATGAFLAACIWVGWVWLRTTTSEVPIENKQLSTVPPPPVLPQQSETPKGAEIAEPPGPLSQEARFTLFLRGGHVFVPDMDKSRTGIVLQVQIRNSGHPSIATDWKLNIIKDGQSHVAQLANPPEQLAVKGGKVWKESDFQLEERAAQKPLRANDAPILSHILFYVKMQKPDVMADETVLELSVEDVTGEKFFARQKMADWR